MSSNIKAPKKLIEVALPLDDINIASAYEKLPGIGAHPRGIHHWWARRPFGAARAIIFAQMVNDPGGERGYYAGKTRKQADQEREQLFDIIRKLCDWKNTNNEAVLENARNAIWKSWRETCELNKGKQGFDPDKLPAFHDPFAGGGAIPLEAQRLGLESYASDLNPVAVMINKAMIEIPPKFAGYAPVGPVMKGEHIYKTDEWVGAQGLAEDVRRYGHWIREEAFKRIGHLYPQVDITAEMAKDRPDLKGLVGQQLTVIAWLWARTVKSSNPAFSHVEVPLVKSFVLSNKKGKNVWVEPVIDGDNYRFVVRISNPTKDAIEGTVQRTGGTCLLSGTAIPFKYIREEGKAGRIGQKLMAIVAEGKNGRIYLSPNQSMEEIIKQAKPEDVPETNLPDNALGFRIQEYGMLKHRDLFTPRQLVALTTFSDLVHKARAKIIEDAKAGGMTDDGKGIDQNGIGATAYSDAISVYLAFAVDRSTDFNNSLTGWRAGNEKIMGLFNRQAIPMVWDFGEANIIENVVGGFITNVEYQSKCIDRVVALGVGHSIQSDAAIQNISKGKVISTDPPYYDNIGYADLSDFFYIWLRRSLKSVYPNLFSTLVTPKSEELVANPYHHGSKEQAEQFFMDGMTRAIHNLAENAHPAFPITIYYAFKQSETKELGTVSTGWETFLEAVIQAGFAITGTWPMRSEQSTRMRSMDSNALASSIVLVCRKRDNDAETISRRQFQKELREKMPEALETMIGGVEGSTPIAPVDLAQAAIGPGMGIFSQYQAVLNQDGSPMSVHEALILINREITDYLNPDSGNFDNDTLFCSSWFAQYGWGSGSFGEADTLARAKGTTVDGVRKSEVIESGGGNVKLMKWEDYPGDWDPKTDHRMPVWEACHHMIRALNQKGETEAGQLLARMPEKGEQIRQLAYHLYTLCERKKWAEEARAYNELITSWHGIVSASHETGHRGEQTSWLD
jgi:putative DNA methylase